MASAGLQIVSDLHLESPAAYDVFEIVPKAPYLALLGDIGYVKDDGFFTFLRKQLANFKVVFLVLGNHEPYHSSWAEIKSRLASFKVEINQATEDGQKLGEFVLLDKVSYDIAPGVTILGCTLFSQIPSSQMESVSFGLSDFYNIDGWSTDNHCEAHLDDLAWLNRQVEHIWHTEPAQKVIILTHYCPSTYQCVVDPKHGSSRISSGFMTDLSTEVCWQREVVRLWAFGHTHYNCDYRDLPAGKRVLSNQRGYYFAQSEGFDSEKVVELLDI